MQGYLVDAVQNGVSIRYNYINESGQSGGGSIGGHLLQVIGNCIVYTSCAIRDSSEYQSYMTRTSYNVITGETRCY